MTIRLREMRFSRLDISALDATYSVRFFEEAKVLDNGRAHKTGFFRVLFSPIESTMTYREDGQRQRTYMLSPRKAIELHDDLKAEPRQYWFALDMASLAERKSKQ